MRRAFWVGEIPGKNSLADLARTNGPSASYLAMDVLRDYIEHEKTLAVSESSQSANHAWRYPRSRSCPYPSAAWWQWLQARRIPG
ncbi:hypothetical protein [Pseudomonas putida]